MFLTTTGLADTEPSIAFQNLSRDTYISLIRAASSSPFYHFILYFIKNNIA